MYRLIAKDEVPLRLNLRYPRSLDSFLFQGATRPFPSPGTSDLDLFGPSEGTFVAETDPLAPPGLRWNGTLPGGVLTPSARDGKPLPPLLNAALGGALIYSIIKTAPPAKAKPNKLW